MFFPSVLRYMSENLDWTQDLGDAMLAQQDEVMEAVQKLHNDAQDAGTLKTTDQQRVETEGDGGPGYYGRSGYWGNANYWNGGWKQPANINRNVQARNRACGREPASEERFRPPLRSMPACSQTNSEISEISLHRPIAIPKATAVDTA